MKRSSLFGFGATAVFVATMIVGLGMAACSSQPSPAPYQPPQPRPAVSAPAPTTALQTMPEFALRPPQKEDTLYGVGSANYAEQQMSMEMADARARQSIAYQIETAAKAMVTDYGRAAGAVNSPASMRLAETIGSQIANAKLRGVSVVERQQMPDGTIWSLCMIKKSAAAQESAMIIENEASSYAEYKAMDALKRMNAELEKTQTKPMIISE
jgi:hypothetical protein